MAILAFHNLDSQFSLGINNYKPYKFRYLCENIKALGYELYGPGDYLARNCATGTICFNFDDGYKSFMEFAQPILMEFSIPAAVFIPSGMIGRKNSWEYSSFIARREHLSASELRRLVDSGIEIGSHGHSHIALTTLSDRFLRMELEKSKRILEDITGHSVDYLSYPFGRVSGRVEAMALEVGYHRGFSLARLPGDNRGFTVRRSAVYAWDSPYSVSLKIGAGPLRGLEHLKERVINFYSGGTILLNRLRGKNLPTAD